MGTRTYRVVREDLQTHSAIGAWRAATSLRVTPDCVHVYRERPRKALYRLPGVAPGGRAVFAKRAAAARTVIERTVYADVLAHLPLTAPRYFGSWLDGSDGWLFVEDVGGRRYSGKEPGQLALAGHWIAQFHVGAARLADAESFPDCGPARYLTHLHTAREKITESLGRWQYPGDESGGLEAVLACCHSLESRWSRVEAACDGARRTVVHGDFRPKNALVRDNGHCCAIYPIDWETAGWGPPCPDLTRIDLHAYWSVVRAAWPEVDLATLERWRRIGRLLEEIAAVMWLTEKLKCESDEARSWGVRDLTEAVHRMVAAAREARVLE